MKFFSERCRTEQTHFVFNGFSETRAVLR